MKRFLAGTTCLAVIGLLANYSIQAQGPKRSFRRVGTFASYLNAGLNSGSVSEIVAATASGRLLVYTDAAGARIGLVDISDPSNPQPAGTIGVGGQPTSVDILGNKFALVGVSTTNGHFDDPTGRLKVYDLQTRLEVADFDLGGQPDSIKLSPNGQYAAVVIENERDEGEEVNGVEGGLPQLPAGFLVVVRTQGPPASWSLSNVQLTGLSVYAPEDPEREFVDINDRNQAVVTLQENNHIVIVDLRTGAILNDFPAGAVDLDAIDADEDEFVTVLDDSLDDVLREPDAVTWVGRDRIATANEGDLFGGSRGFSVFAANGTGVPVFDSGSTFEHLAVRHGHYPESRSENKGTEPESIEYAKFGPDNLLFVGSERGCAAAGLGLHDPGM